MKGNYLVNLDSKGRVIIPSKFRKELGNDVIISHEFDNSLVLRSVDEFNLWSSKLEDLSEFDSSSRKIKRAILSSAFDLMIDAKGRINIPDILIEESNLSNEIKIIGIGNKLEIISKKVYDDMKLEFKTGLIEKAADNIETK